MNHKQEEIIEAVFTATEHKDNASSHVISLCHAEISMQDLEEMKKDGWL
ncbi:MAG: hypothetical protein HQL32_14640, partial [Planctomycetes bacterium]|nr:hypothetical protein [Planctomycetota bacterium]